MSIDHQGTPNRTASDHVATDYSVTGRSRFQWACIIGGLLILGLIAGAWQPAVAQQSASQQSASQQLSAPHIPSVAESALEERERVLYLDGSPYSGRVDEPGVAQGWVTDGRRDGLWRRFSAEGHLESKLVFAEGNLLRQTQVRADGTVSQEWSFSAGVPDGFARSWNLNETLKEEFVFRQGRRHGHYALYDHNGDLMYSATYEHGVLDGEAIWYYPDGSRRWVTYYHNGERSGTWEQFAVDGSLQMRTEWENDAIVARFNPHEGH